MRVFPLSFSEYKSVHDGSNNLNYLYFGCCFFHDIKVMKDDNGIVTIGLFEFLLNENSLEL